MKKVLIDKIFDDLNKWYDLIYRLFYVKKKYFIYYLFNIYIIFKEFFIYVIVEKDIRYMYVDMILLLWM